jgi:hypothetical protein
MPRPAWTMILLLMPPAVDWMTDVNHRAQPLVEMGSWKLSPLPWVGLELWSSPSLPYMGRKVCATMPGYEVDFLMKAFSSKSTQELFYFQIQKYSGDHRKFWSCFRFTLCWGKGSSFWALCESLAWRFAQRNYSFPSTRKRPLRPERDRHSENS